MSAVVAPKKQDMSDAERQARIDLAACYRLVARNGWDDLIYTHVSAAVPGPTKHFLINPYGMMFGEITASSLVKVDIDGNIASDTPYKINPAGYTIHSAVHAAREDVKCVLHLHTNAGVAVSSQKQGLLPLNQTALVVYSDLAYHDYEGIALDLDERERLVANLGGKNHFMLRNHGTLTVGHTVAAAYVRMFFLERACQMQIAAQSGGAELNLLSKAMQERVHRQATTGSAGVGERDWPALLRLLDREDPSYKN
ncbi:MAG TPA: class II aldolase/adducin family protein [Burkholderiales bacterium]|jgi:ribulose-5-phosphate 4-epimerase/fuculose-1-phosphate aldolase